MEKEEPKSPFLEVELEKLNEIYNNNNLKIENEAIKTSLNHLFMHIRENSLPSYHNFQPCFSNELLKHARRIVCNVFKLIEKWKLETILEKEKDFKIFLIFTLAYLHDLGLSQKCVDIRFCSPEEIYNKFDNMLRKYLDEVGFEIFGWVKDGRITGVEEGNKDFRFYFFQIFYVALFGIRFEESIINIKYLLEIYDKEINARELKVLITIFHIARLMDYTMDYLPFWEEGVFSTIIKKPDLISNISFVKKITAKITEEEGEKTHKIEITITNDADIHRNRRCMEIKQFFEKRLDSIKKLCNEDLNIELEICCEKKEINNSLKDEENILIQWLNIINSGGSYFQKKEQLLHLLERHSSNNNFAVEIIKSEIESLKGAIELYTSRETDSINRFFKKSVSIVLGILSKDEIEEEDKLLVVARLFSNISSLVALKMSIPIDKKNIHLKDFFIFASIFFTASYINSTNVKNEIKLQLMIRTISDYYRLVSYKNIKKFFFKHAAMIFNDTEPNEGKIGEGIFIGELKSILEDFQIDTKKITCINKLKRNEENKKILEYMEDIDEFARGITKKLRKEGKLNVKELWDNLETKFKEFKKGYMDSLLKNKDECFITKQLKFHFIISPVRTIIRIISKESRKALANENNQPKSNYKKWLSVKKELLSHVIELVGNNFPEYFSKNFIEKIFLDKITAEAILAFFEIGLDRKKLHSLKKELIPKLIEINDRTRRRNGSKGGITYTDTYLTDKTKGILNLVLTRIIFTENILAIKEEKSDNNTKQLSLIIFHALEKLSDNLSHALFYRGDENFLVSKFLKEIGEKITDFEKNEGEIDKCVKCFYKSLDVLTKFFSSLTLARNDKKIKKNYEEKFLKKIEEKDENYLKTLPIDCDALRRFPNENSFCVMDCNDSQILGFNKTLSIKNDNSTTYHLLFAEKNSIQAERKNYPDIKINGNTAIVDWPSYNNAINSHQSAQKSFSRVIRRLKCKDTSDYYWRALANYPYRMYYNQLAWENFKKAFVKTTIEAKNSEESTNDPTKFLSEVREKWRFREFKLERAATYFRLAACFSITTETDKFAEKSWGRRKLSLGFESIYKIGKVFVEDKRCDDKLLESAKSYLADARIYFRNVNNEEQHSIYLTRYLEEFAELLFHIGKIRFSKITKENISEENKKHITKLRSLNKAYENAKEKFPYMGRIGLFSEITEILIAYLEFLENVLNYKQENLEDYLESIKELKRKIDEILFIIPPYFYELLNILQEILYFYKFEKEMYKKDLTEIEEEINSIIVNKNNFENIEEKNPKQSHPSLLMTLLKQKDWASILKIILSIVKLLIKDKKIDDSLSIKFTEKMKKLKDNTKSHKLLLPISFYAKNEYGWITEEILKVITQLYSNLTIVNSSSDNIIDKILNYDDLIQTLTGSEEHFYNNGAINHFYSEIKYSIINYLICEFLELKDSQKEKLISKLENNERLAFNIKFTKISPQNEESANYNRERSFLLKYHTLIYNKTNSIFSSDDIVEFIKILYSLEHLKKKNRKIVFILGAGISVPIPLLFELRHRIVDWFIINKYLMEISNNKHNITQFPFLWDIWIHFAHVTRKSLANVKERFDVLIQFIKAIIKESQTINNQNNHLSSSKGSFKEIIEKHINTINDDISTAIREEIDELFDITKSEVRVLASYSEKDISFNMFSEAVGKTFSKLYSLEGNVKEELTVEDMLTIRRLISIYDKERIFSNLFRFINVNIDKVFEKNTNISIIEKTLENMESILAKMTLISNCQTGHKSVIKFIIKLKELITLEGDIMFPIPFIIMNYDLGIEKAIKEKELEYVYVGNSNTNENNGNTIAKIYKIHGSANYGCCDKCFRREYISLEKIKDLTEANKENQPLKFKCSSKTCEGELRVKMVPPSLFKEINDTHLITLKNEAINAIYNAGLIISIGYKFGEGDSDVQEIIIEGLKKRANKGLISPMLVIDPSDEAFKSINKKFKNARLASPISISANSHNIKEKLFNEILTKVFT